MRPRSRCDAAWFSWPRRSGETSNPGALFSGLWTYPNSPKPVSCSGDWRSCSRTWRAWHRVRLWRRQTRFGIDRPCSPKLAGDHVVQGDSMKCGLAVFGAGQIQNPRLTCFIEVAPHHGQPCFPMLVHVGFVCRRRPGLGHFEPHRGVLVQWTQQPIHGVQNAQPPLRTTDDFLRSRSQIQRFERISLKVHPAANSEPGRHAWCQRGPGQCGAESCAGPILLGTTFLTATMDAATSKLSTGERAVELVGGQGKGSAFGWGQQNEHGTKFWEMPVTSTS